MDKHAMMDKFARDAYEKGSFNGTWLCAENGEIAKYNQFALLYSTAYSEWVNFYNRTHMPKQPGRWVL